VSDTEVEIRAYDNGPRRLPHVGAQLLTAVAHAWGVRITADRSRMVWASFALAAMPPRCAWVSPVTHRACSAEGHAIYQAMLQQFDPVTGLPPEVPLCERHGRQLGWLQLRSLQE
jgi:hypothetical protein